MTSCVIHFGMINEIKTLFKENELNVGIHVVGGCSCSGIKLDAITKEDLEMSIDIMNVYLKGRYMYVVQDEKDESVFHPKTILK